MPQEQNSDAGQQSQDLNPSDQQPDQAEPRSFARENSGKTDEDMQENDETNRTTEGVKQDRGTRQP